jgi:hypothetical protein
MTTSGIRTYTQRLVVHRRCTTDEYVLCKGVRRRHASTRQAREYAAVCSSVQEARDFSVR